MGSLADGKVPGSYHPLATPYMPRGGPYARDGSQQLPRQPHGNKMRNKMRSGMPSAHCSHGGRYVLIARGETVRITTAVLLVLLRLANRLRRPCATNQLSCTTQLYSCTASTAHVQTLAQLMCTTVQLYCQYSPRASPRSAHGLLGLGERHLELGLKEWGSRVWGLGLKISI